jgi:hypothetical protein
VSLLVRPIIIGVGLAGYDAAAFSGIDARRGACLYPLRPVFLAHLEERHDDAQYWAAGSYVYLAINVTDQQLSQGSPETGAHGH